MAHLYKNYNQMYRANLGHRTWVTPTSPEYQQKLEREGILAIVGLGPKPKKIDEPDETIQESSGASTPSMVSSVHSKDSQVYGMTKELMHEVKQMTINNAGRIDPTLDPLLNDTTDAWFRMNVEREQDLPLQLQKGVDKRFKRSIGKTPRNRTKNTPRISSEIVFSNDFDTNGLVPTLDPSTQLSILKAQEKLILLDRWRGVWESVRPARSKWWELSGPEFSRELARNRALLEDSNLQELSYQTRLQLADLHRSILLDESFDLFNPQNRKLDRSASSNTLKSQSGLNSKKTSIMTLPLKG